jgi:hypothetical protein
VKFVSCHNGTTCVQVADIRERLQVRRVRINVVPLYAMQALDGGEFVIVTPQLLFTLCWRLGGLQSRSGQTGWRKNPLPLLGIELGSPSP